MFKNKLKPKKTVVSQKTELLTKAQPFPYKEAYKALRTNINFATHNGRLKRIAITSTIPNEGKSTVVVNLAISLIEDGKKVLLIDADLRNPSIHKHLRVRQEQYVGLSNLLSSSDLITNSIRHIEKFDLDILMSGSIPPNPAELLGSERFAEILKDVEAHYDYILIDTPPVGVVADAAILSQHVDGVIMVVGHKKANEKQIKAAKHNLERVNANVIGSILNNYDVSLDNNNTGLSYYYYYGNK